MSLSIPTSLVLSSNDPKPNSPDTPVGTILIETDTGVQYYWSGAKWLTWSQRYKEGRWMGVTQTSADGLFASNTASAGSTLKQFDSVYGLHQKFFTGSTINTFAGVRMTGYADRGLNPHLRVVFALDQVTDCQMYVGFTSYVSAVGMPTATETSDFFPTNSAAGLKLEANAANFTFYHNNGASPGTTEVTTVATADTTIHTFEVRIIGGGTSIQYKIDNGTTWTDITTDLPDIFIDMGVQCWLKNTVASDKTWRLIDIQTRIDNRS